MLEADEQLRRDERAELELRLHVGEIVGEEADTAFHAVDEALSRLMSEKDDLSARITELDSLLEEPPARGPTPAEASQAIAEVAAAIEPVHEVPPTPVSPVKAIEAVSDQASIVTAEHEVERATTEAAIRTPAGSDRQAIDNDPRRTPGGTFDELAFLSDIVGEGKPSNATTASNASNASTATSAAPAAPPKVDGSSESLLAGLSEPGRRRSGEAPLGSNVPGHTPIVLRTATSAEQVKTLKCTECGAMNYATEWYCERCGAELAAL